MSRGAEAKRGGLYRLVRDRRWPLRLRPDRTRLGDYPLTPDTPAVTCPVAVALELWRRDSVAPAARTLIGSEALRGSSISARSPCRPNVRRCGRSVESETPLPNAYRYCRIRVRRRRRISVSDDWEGAAPEGAFLREGCGTAAVRSFATVLSPDYNAAHADHFHLDQTTAGRAFAVAANSIRARNRPKRTVRIGSFAPSIPIAFRKAANIDVDRAQFDVGPRAPHTVEQLAAAEHPARAFHEELEAAVPVGPSCSARPRRWTLCAQNDRNRDGYRRPRWFRRPAPDGCGGITAATRASIRGG